MRLSSCGACRLGDNGRVIDFPWNATAIPGNAFCNSGATSIQNWVCIRIIGGHAFSHNRIIFLPENWGKMTAFGDYAFGHNGIDVLSEFWGLMRDVGD